MIELIMYFAIGALFASLGAIALLPALWRRAVRLTKRDLQATLPVTPEEIAAQRDQIRAAAAVDQRRLEQRIDTADRSLREARAEIGERIATIQSHEATIAARDAEISALKTDIARKTETLATRDESIATLGRERDNLATNLSASRISNQALDQESINLRQAAEQRQARIEEQDTQITGLLDKIAEIQNVSGTMRAELQQRNGELRAAARSHRELTARLSILERKLATAEAIAADTAQQVGQLQDERTRLSGELALTGQDRETRRIEAASLLTQVEQLGARIADHEALHERQRAQHSEVVRDLTRTIDVLRQEKRQIDDEISAMRFENSRRETRKTRQRPVRPASNAPVE